MFTGIIQHVGQVVAAEHSPAGSRLVIATGPLAVSLALGDSLACDGVCLTVAEISSGSATFSVSPETVRKTTLGSWSVGRRINIEPALRLGDRLGGHLVSGHVDGIGEVLARVVEGDSERFTIRLPATVKVVEKGSLAVDGISLTTWNCRADAASIAVIPHTLAHTTLGDRQPGDAVNLEQDQIGRWVERLLGSR